MSSPSLFTLTSLLSFVAVLSVLSLSFLSAKLALPASSTRKDSLTFVWLAFDALIHLYVSRPLPSFPSRIPLTRPPAHSSFEGSFLFLSFPPPRTVNSALPGPFKSLWLEYAQADTRWGTADPTVVSLELLTVLGAGPLCCYILWQMVKGDRARHYWL